MDDDTRDMARRFDNLEADPDKLTLFRLLYMVDDHLRELPKSGAQQQADDALMQLLEAVRLLPPARPQQQ